MTHALRVCCLFLYGMAVLALHGGRVGWFLILIGVWSPVSVVFERRLEEEGRKG